MIVKSTYLYEILLRFNKAGFQGAHRIDIQSVDDNVTGENLGQKALSAVPLDGATARRVMTAQSAVLLEQVEQLQADLLACAEEQTNWLDREAALSAEITSLRSQLATALEALDDVSRAEDPADLYVPPNKQPVPPPPDVFGA